MLIAAVQQRWIY